MKAYRRYLVDEDYAVTTINKKVNSLRAFNDFQIEQGLMEEMVVEPSSEKGKGQRQEQDGSPPAALHRVRVSELVNIKLRDIDLLGRELKVVGKGGKYREVPLNTTVVNSIREYIDGDRQEHKLSGSAHLILTQRSYKCHRDTINNLLNNMGEELGIKMYPHKFRHTTFTMLATFRIILFPSHIFLLLCCCDPV